MAIALMFAVSYAIGQESATHIVQRGETMEYIAQLYGVSIDELKASNPDMDLFYTGIELNIPQRKTDIAATDAGAPTVAASRTRLQAYRDDCAAADRLFKGGEYKKAQKMYRQIISEYGNELACTDALYSNALCSYNREKWKSAIEDLRAVVNNKSCSDAQRDHCKQLLAKAHSYCDQQLENRANFWGGLITTAAVVGTSVALASTQSGNQAVGSSGMAGTSSYGSSYDDSSSSAESSSSSGTSTQSSKSSCPSLRINNGKWYCCNTGRCGMCNGDGMMDNGIKVNQFKCTLCNGTGKCKYCQ